MDMDMDMTMNTGAGGFLNDSTSFTADKEPLKRGQNIVPVVIAQIINSSNELKIWGIPANVLTFIGVLRKVEELTTKITHEIEDETGTITALRWIEANKTEPEQALEINSYVRIYGKIRDYNGKKQIFILHIQPLEELNELTNHLLEVTYATLKAKQRNKTQSGLAVSINVDDKATFNDDNTGMNKEQATVLKIIQAADDNDSGIERSDIMSRVPKSILPRVDDIIHFLTCEGHIYTTCTEDHFKAT